MNGFLPFLTGDTALLHLLPTFLAGISACPRPSDQPRDAARREECSDLDEKSLPTFCR